MAGSQALASCASDSSGSCKRIKRCCYWRLRSSVHGSSCNGRVSRSKALAQAAGGCYPQLRGAEIKDRGYVLRVETAYLDDVKVAVAIAIGSTFHLMTGLEHDAVTAAIRYAASAVGRRRSLDAQYPSCSGHRHSADFSDSVTARGCAADLAAVDPGRFSSSGASNHAGSNPFRRRESTAPSSPRRSADPRRSTRARAVTLASQFGL